MRILFYVFHIVIALTAVWFVVAGLLSFRTRRITLYLGEKPFTFEGRRAIAAEICAVLVGLAFLAYAIYVLHGVMTAIEAGEMPGAADSSG